MGKEALLDRVWPGTFVNEATLSQNILTLRKALGKQANGEDYIGTVPKRGYRFEAPVTESAPADLAILSAELVPRTAGTARAVPLSRHVALYASMAVAVMLIISTMYLVRWRRARAAATIAPPKIQSIAVLLADELVG